MISTNTETATSNTTASLAVDWAIIRLSQELSQAIVQKGTPDLIRMLISAGADINADDGHALWAASYHGRADVVRLLLAAGADASARGDGALRWARKNGHYDVAKLLIDWAS